MKKNLWVLLALSALIAMFVIAGCAPKPTPTPTPTPTTEPTAPPADTAAPKVVSTEVFKYYGAVGNSCNDCGYCDLPSVEGALYSNCDCDPDTTFEKVLPLTSQNFKIVITFDENIDSLVSSCIYNPASWEIFVKNAGRVTKSIPAIFRSAEINGKQIIVTASIMENGSLTLIPGYGVDPVTNYFAFCGLICNLNDAKQYAAVVNGPYAIYSFAMAAPTVADEVTWKLLGSCVVADELGNLTCGYSGSDCCLEATCDTCEEGCPFDDPTCVTCENPCL